MDTFTAMRTFVAVVQNGSMNAAARQLNVTSALIGQRITALEAHLQVRLLNRTTRQQSMTDFGARYYDQCRDILEMVALSEGRASDEHIHPQGRLRIAAPVSFGTEALMPKLKEFTEIAPNVDIDLILSDTNEDLVDGGFDVAFRIGQLDDSTLIQTALDPYEMVICAAPDYVLTYPAPVSPTDLDAHHAVLFSKTGRKAWRFSKDGQTVRWTPKSQVTVNSGHAVRVAAKAGMGVTMLPKVLVKDDLDDGTLIQLLKDWQLPQQPMSLVFHQDRYRPQRLERFIDFAKSTFRTNRNE